MAKKLPSSIQTERSLSQLQAVKQLLSISGNNKEIDEMVKRIGEFESQAKSVLAIPELFLKFNKYFNPFGWHAHGSLPIHLLEQANQLAESNLFEDAETLIMSHYIDKFEYHFILLRGLPTYFEREHIFETAKERFFQEDYISCVPLILMMVDGIGYDAFNSVTFKNGIDFNIWDSISTINGDIDSLIKEITSTRRKFTSENLTIPYRNGILHGIDVGYGNKSVAVKAWALLFTIRDILVDKRNEESERTKYDKQQKKEQEEFLSFVENSIKYINGVLDYANSFYNWKPSRTQSQWDMLIKTGLPQDFPENSPEQCIISFLYGWKISNYGLMADLVHRKNDTTKGMLAGQLRWSLKTKSLLDYQIDFIQEERGGIVFGTTITFAERGIELNKDICLIVDYYIDGKKSYCSGGSGKWLLNDVIIPMLCYLPTQGEETP